MKFYDVKGVDDEPMKFFHSTGEEDTNPTSFVLTLAAGLPSRRWKVLF
jgi:hypothetical protein